MLMENHVLGNTQSNFETSDYSELQNHKPKFWKNEKQSQISCFHFIEIFT